MKNEKTELVTAGNIAKELGVSDNKLKKVIKELGIKPEAKKGVCNYYSRDALAKIKAALKLRLVPNSRSVAAKPRLNLGNRRKRHQSRLTLRAPDGCADAMNFNCAGLVGVMLNLNFLLRSSRR